jgi:GNAT superfamily N-acetyltransferase
VAHSSTGPAAHFHRLEGLAMIENTTDVERVEYVDGGVDLLEAIAPLWEEKKEHHSELSQYFRTRCSTLSFRDKKASFLLKANGGNLRLHLATLPPDGRSIGYCVSSISSQGVAEVESLFVLPDWRGMGIGAALLHRTLRWMKGKGADAKRVRVVAGNERVYSLYREFGFAPAFTVLEQVSENE